MVINGHLKFHNSAIDELQNVVIQKTDMGTSPASFNAAVSIPGDTGGNADGRLLFNTNATTGNSYWFYDGTNWVEVGSQELAENLRDAGAIYTTAGNFDGGTVNGALGNVTGAADLLDVLEQLDTAITAAAGVDTLKELNDVDVDSEGTSPAYADGDVFYYVSGTGKWQNAPAGSTSGIQPYDAGLANLATGGTGMVSMDGDTVTFRTLTAATTGLEGIDISNGAGTAGNPTIGLDLDGLTEETSPVVGDFLVLNDGTNNLKVSVGNIAALAGTVIPLGDLVNVADANQTGTGASQVTATTTDNAYFFKGNSGGDGYDVQDGTLGALNNVASGVDSATTEDVLSFNGTMWTAITPSTMLADDTVSIGDIYDVTITSVGDDEVLTYDNGSGKWINETLAEAGIQASDAGLDSLAALTGVGYVVATATDTFVMRTIAAESSNNDELGIIVNDGDGTTQTTIGLDIDGRTAMTTGFVAASDTLLIFDSTNSTNKKVSIDDLADQIIATSIALDDLSDVDDATAHTSGTAYLFVGDGTNLDVTEITASAPPNFVEAIEDIVGAMGVDGTDTTFVYDDVADPGTIKWNVDDVFLRNTGDTLDSGVLTVASGAQITIATGGDLVITDAPVNGTDAANKDYVDSLASGLDPKESVRAATVGANIGSYTTGQITGAPDTLDGVTLVAGDRILVKDQTDAQQNGIYVVTTLGTGSNGVWDRAADHDGTPSNEVSGGNHTFVEQGSVNKDSGWVLMGDGELTLDSDDIDWTQFTGAGSFTAGLGINQSGSTIFLQTRELSSATIALADTLVFADLTITPSGTEGGDRVTTVQQFLDDLGVLTQVAGGNAITAADGVQVTDSGTSVAVELNLNGLSNIASEAADIMVFGDSSDTFNSHIKRTVTEFISDHNILTGGSGGALTGSDGVIVSAGDVQLDIGGLGAATITTADTIAFNDGDTAGAGGTHAKTTVANFLADLDVVTLAFGAGGMIAQTAADTYAARTISVEGAGAEAGLSIDNGDGVAGNPTLGLDIANLANAASAPVGTDEFVVYDGVNNEAVSMSQLASYLNTATNLTDLNDVDTTGVAAGNILTYNGATWEDGTDEFTISDGSNTSPIGLGDTLTIQGTTESATQFETTVAESAGTVTITVTGGLNALDDVVITSAASGDVLVHDGSDFDNKPIHFVSTQSSATSWTVTHNLGQQYVNVTVVDGSDQVIIPQSITMTSASVTTITFNTAVAGKAIITGVAGAPTESV